MTATLAAPVPIAAATSGGAKPADSFSTPALGFNAVAADSATDAWAVGGNLSGGALVAHWNGTAWVQVSLGAAGTQVPLGTGDVNLTGVAATSSGNVWAVARRVSNSGAQSGEILHWNGSAWARTASPAGSLPAAVAATSATNAWAVGIVGTGGGTGVGPTNTALILHWNGSTWTRVAAHLPSTLGNLRGVTAISATDA